MKEKQESAEEQLHTELKKTYSKEKPGFISRLRRAGRSLEEAEDFIHDVYAESIENLPLLSTVRNLPAWINFLFTRRLIDVWRHEKVRREVGETDVTDETLNEIIADAGLDPMNSFVRDALMDALDDALRALPKSQRQVIEAQVFGNKTFRQISDETGLSIDTLSARKRYAIKNLSVALRHWIDD